MERAMSSSYQRTTVSGLVNNFKGVFMKKTLLVFGLALTSSVWAADSQWLLCDDGGLALNVVSHRLGAEEKLTDLALIHGSQILLGELKGDEGDVVLKSADKKVFKGHVKIKDKLVTVNGSLLLSGKISSPVNAQLKCKEMEGSGK